MLRRTRCCDNDKEPCCIFPRLYLTFSKSPHATYPGRWPGIVLGAQPCEFRSHAVSEGTGCNLYRQRKAKKSFVQRADGGRVTRVWCAGTVLSLSKQTGISMTLKEMQLWPEMNLTS